MPIWKADVFNDKVAWIHGEKNNPDTIQNSIIYANNAATTWPKPPSVLVAVSQAAAGPYLEQGRTTLQDVPRLPVRNTKKTCQLFQYQRS